MFICNVATCTRHSVNQTQTHKHKQPAIMIDKFEVTVMVNIDSSTLIVLKDPHNQDQAFS